MNALFDHDAEAALIGAMMQDENARRHTGTLTETDFDDDLARVSFSALESLQTQHSPIDLRTLTDEAARLSGRDVLGYLIECNRLCPTAHNADAYYRIVTDHSRRRALHRTLRGQADMLLDPTADMDAITETVRIGLSAGRGNGHIVTMNDAMMTAFDGIERAARGESDAIPTGIADLDWLTGGLYPGEMTILGARPKKGKSSLALEIAMNVAKAGYRVLVDSLEMSAKQYAQRVLARHSGVGLRNIRLGQIGDNQWEPLGNAANTCSQMPIQFTFDVYTPEELRAVAEAVNPQLIVVDYLQLMDTKKKADNDTVRLGKISGALKALALDCNIPVLALAQVTRTEGRAAVMPILKELRGSGNLEQDADNVIFM
ncbi:MAG: hypothetical protein EOM69_10020, partial [Clostridia bacterium]|nr:hypothetical protein [Clostridia bacterium]